MDMELQNRRALITGSTAGIGFAIARGLAAEGTAVVLNGRKPESLERAIARLHQEVPGARVEGVVADAATAEGAQEVFTRVPEVDLLINNVGIYELKLFSDITDAEWTRLFEVNVMSGVRFSRHYMAGMRQRGWGRILFVSSESALRVPPDLIHYAMTKTAQLTVARGLAIELAATGVTVNSILPGPTRTEGVTELLHKLSAQAGVSPELFEAEFMRTERPTSLIRRLSSPEEVASLAVYLCSPKAASTTGTAVRVDGGLVNVIM